MVAAVDSSFALNDDGLCAVLQAFGSGTSAVDGWLALARTNRRLSAVIKEWLEREVVSLEVGVCCRVDLRRLVAVCPKLTSLQLRGLRGDSDLRELVVQPPRLRSLDLANCSLITDVGLRLVFAHCPSLVSIDLSSGRSITDAPFAGAPASLESLYLWNCEQLTHRAVESLEHCNALSILHFTASLRLEVSLDRLARALLHFRSLVELHCLDVAADDDFISTISSLPQLSELSVMCVSVACEISDHGLETLSRGLGSSLTKLTLDPCWRLGDRGLAALGDRCPRLKELELMPQVALASSVATIPFAPTLVRLCLERCGLQGEFDCSSLVNLEVIWLYGNAGLTGVVGEGQKIRKLNLGATGCTIVHGFSLAAVELIDIADLGFYDIMLESLISEGIDRLQRLVLGGNNPSLALLRDLLPDARRLTHLNVLRCPESVAAGLLLDIGAALTTAPRLEVLEVSSDAVAEALCMPECQLICSGRSAPMLSLRDGLYIDHRAEVDYESSSPYGRQEDAAESW